MSKPIIFLVLFAFVAVFLMPASIMKVNAQDCIEGETKVCGSNIGLCESGEQMCLAGHWDECSGGVEPEREICGNELDDDCDGAIDECLTSIWTIMAMVGFLLLFVMIMLIKMGFGGSG
jgi:hypothetical protein